MNEVNQTDDNSEVVLVDFNETKQIIIVTDKTKNHLLDPNTNDFWEALICNDFIEITKDVYCFNWTNKINFTDFLKRLKWFKIAYSLSTNLNYFLDTEQINNFSTRQEEARKIKDFGNLESGSDFLKFKEIVNHEINPNFHLEKNQFQNIYHHLKLQSSMDFSVPGTGKTLIAYALFIYLFSQWKKEQLVNKLVVVGPLNCFKAWKDEAKNFFYSKHNFSIFDVSTMPKDEKISNIIGNNYTIYLFNYEFFNSKEKVKLLTDYLLDEKTFLVFDEIHRIKGIKAIRANHIIDMIANAKHPPIYKLALTGTPLPNSYVDLINYLRILYPIELQSELSLLNQDFLKAADTDFYKAKQVQKMLYSLFMRINKKDLNVPAPNPDDIKTLAVDLTPQELMLFGKIYKLCPNPFLRFVRLIQLASNPKLLLKQINEEEIKQIEEETDSNLITFPQVSTALNLDDEDKKMINTINLATKTKKTIELIKKKVDEHQPVIVWCLFIDTIDLLASELAKLNIKATTICGRDSVQDRDDKIEAFKRHQYDVLITNPNTLAESVSLHRICHNAIYLEFGFNLTYLLQSKDRIHRVGLLPTDETNYYFAIAKSTKVASPIDEYIYKRLGDKANRMKEAIDSKDLILPKKWSQTEDIQAVMQNLK